MGTKFSINLLLFLQEQKEKTKDYHPALLRGKERCSHHLLKSSPNHLRSPVLGPLTLGFAAPLGGGLDGLGPRLRLAPRRRLGGGCCCGAGVGAVAGGSPSAMSRLRCCRRQIGCNSGPPGRMWLIASDCFCTAENCWAKFSTASPK